MKKLLLFMAVAIAAMSLSAAPVDQAKALQKAKSYLTTELFAGKIMAPEALNPVLLKAEPSDVVKSQPVYYIYNTSETFLVVAGDDRAEEILMVGDRPLKDINNLAPGMKDVLNLYKQEIQFLQERPNLKVDPVRHTKSTSLRATSYLMTALWDQEDPYWNLCKFTRNGTTYQCLTGCPATSASMVMYYWKYPTTQVAAMPSYNGTLEVSYYSSYSFTYPALSATTFDWDNMRDSYTGNYTSAQGSAVATLMRYVGQGEHMMYGTESAGGSGIYTTDTQNIVDMYVGFGYDETTCRVVQKSSYSTSGWASLIQNEIAEGRPMVYMAVSNGGGHAFNVDGYDSSSNKYHVNFGWSGDGNSWYSMNSFTYGGYTFNQDQQAVIGIQPPAATTPVLTVNPTSLTFTGCQTGQTYTKTFTVTGTDLRGNVTVSSNNGTFTVSPTTITATQAAAGATVTVTYKPTSSGTQTGTITLSSSGAESKTVSVSGTATTTPTVSADPTSLTFNTTVGTPVNKTFTLSGTNLSANVYIAVNGAEFSVDKTVVTQTAAGIGTTVTVTYTPTAVGTHTGTITCTSNGAQSATVTLNGTAQMVKYAPVMLPANEDYIGLTKFRADWTDATPAENVTSYTLEVTPKPTQPAVELIGSVAGTDFTSSSTYYDITLPAPWGGNNLRGANNRAIYFRQKGYQNMTQEGKITFTIPAGYDNMTFTMKITTDNTSDGSGNLTVATPQTAAVGHNFSAGETYSWVVTASAGEQITITSTKTSYSPDMAKLEVYTGDASAMLTATETGGADYRLITGITDKFYTVENLTAEGTFLYKVKALYKDGTESEWSNIEEVTLFDNTPAYIRGDVNGDNNVNMDDLTALINYLVYGSTVNQAGAASCNNADDTTVVNMDDLTALINYLVYGQWDN